MTCAGQQGALATAAEDAVSSLPELTPEMAKKLVAAVVSQIQEAISRGGSPGAARLAELRSWGFSDAAQMEDCVRRCCTESDDQYLRSWYSLYRELARVIDPPLVKAEADPNLASARLAKAVSTNHKAMRENQEASIQSSCCWEMAD
ncbi:unnamed protein product [Polarella glacialis]|uniref:Uncharacterized protein n=1 Tax=Polarella glacialis TaxID=89957 RepID=A0A813GGH0_POLGL|nr:unnamed protein product [Polarella glacialis]